MPYQTNAVLQKIIAQKLTSLASTQINLYKKNILDIGCGTGFVAQNLVQLGVKPSSILQIDKNPVALNYSKQFGGIMQADFNNPFQFNQKFGIIFSSMALQWAENFQKTTLHLQNLLIESGSFFVAIPMYGSLQTIYDILEITPFSFPKMEDIQSFARIIHTQIYMENSYIALKNIHISNLLLKQNTNITKNKLILLKNATTAWNISFLHLSNAG